MTVYFYAQTAPYTEFSNLAPYGFEISHQYYPTAEHFFQAVIYKARTDRVRPRRVASPRYARSLGPDRHPRLCCDWKKARNAIMIATLGCKFSPPAALPELLLGTDNLQIVNTSPAEVSWGSATDCSGLNRLGAWLMQVWSELKEGHI